MEEDVLEVLEVLTLTRLVTFQPGREKSVIMENAAI